MPWKLIFFLVLAVVLVAFIGFNLSNSCDVSFGFARIQGVPVYLTILVSFLLGMLAVTPFAFHFIRKKGSKAKPAAQAGTPDQAKADEPAASPAAGASASGEGTDAKAADGTEPKAKKRLRRKAISGD